MAVFNYRKAWGCVTALLLLSLIDWTLGKNQELDVNKASSRDGTRGSLPQNFTGNSDSETLSLEVNSELILFSIQNNSRGITVTVTPLCSDQALCDMPQSLDLVGIFLPPECSSVPCDHQLVRITALNQTTTEYIIGVPSNQSILLLRFFFAKNSRHFELIEKAVVSEGITDKYNCNPTSVVQLNEDFYTLCVDAPKERLRPLKITNLNNFRDVSFNPVTEVWITVTLPISDVSVLSHSEADLEYILFVSGKNLIVIDIEVTEFTRTYFSGCRWTINRIQLFNDSQIDYNTIPYLLYCDRDYGLVDIADLYEPWPHSYNETGYPVVCQRNKSVVATLTIAKNCSNSTLYYGKKSISLPGRDILLEDSMCFGIEESLFYVYTDLKLGTVLVDLLEHRAVNYLSVEADQHYTIPRVFQDRYILLEDDSSMTLRLYDVTQQRFRADISLSHSSNLIQLLIFPQSQSHGLSPQLRAVVAVGVCLTIVTAALVLLAIGYAWKKTRRRATPPYSSEESSCRPVQPTRLSSLDLTILPASVRYNRLKSSSESSSASNSPSPTRAPINQEPTNVPPQLVTGAS